VVRDGAFSVFFMPAVVLGAIAVFVLVLRWASLGSSTSSLVARRPRSGSPDDYGLLVPVSAPGTYIEGEIQRRALEDHGLRASLVITNDGPRVMVWPENEQRARAILRTPPPPPQPPQRPPA
jgi:hypothetical protein